MSKDAPTVHIGPEVVVRPLLNSSVIDMKKVSTSLDIKSRLNLIMSHLNPCPGTSIVLVLGFIFLMVGLGKKFYEVSNLFKIHKCQNNFPTDISGHYDGQKKLFGVVVAGLIFMLELFCHHKK